jgi:protoporphyrinogen oxidase
MSYNFNSSKQNHFDVLIIGAGISGLSAAFEVHKKGLTFKIIEATSSVGGRMKTERIEGFQLDRGLHFFQTAYPEAAKLLNYDELELSEVYQGALVYHNNDFSLLSNPFKKPSDLLSSMIADIASWKDKLKIISLIFALKNNEIASIIKDSKISAEDFFKQYGFSELFINSFFRPFVGSILHDPKMESSADYVLFGLKMIIQGDVTLPKNGIAALPEQIAAKLPEDSIIFNNKVKFIEDNQITLSDGTSLSAKKIIISINPLDLKCLLPELDINPESNHVSCLYFTTSEKPPVSKPVIVLNGENKGLVNSMFVPSLVVKNYAPEGQHLISVSVIKENDLDDEELTDKVLSEMSQWFGINVNYWEHIKTYHIKYALPKHGKLCEKIVFNKYNEVVFLCGDYFNYGSINSAILSGRKAAEEVISLIKKGRNKNSGKVSV